LVSSNLFANTKVSLADRVKHLEELNQTRNQVQADISFQISQLQREVRSLTGQVEENSFKLQQIQERQRELYRDIENRLSSQPVTNSVEKSEQGGVASNPDTPPATTESIEHGDAGREFEAAFSLVRSKEYTASINAFSKFLLKYPNSNYSDNARYWMGQVYLVQGNLVDAEKQFNLLVSEFPESSKVLAAQLKLGDIYFKQENWSQAKIQYNNVFSQAEGSQKQLARKGLDNIKKAGH